MMSSSSISSDLYGAATLFLLLITAAFSTHVEPRLCGGDVRHVHLAVGRDPATEMTVSFASIPSRYSDAPLGGVLLGLSPTELQLVIEEEGPTSYNLTTAMGSNFEKNAYYSPYYHHVRLTGLEPNTTYFYRPILQANEEGFKQYSLRPRQPAMSELEAKEALAAEDQEEREEGEQGQRTQRSLLVHRQLISWAPYDGSGKPCPDPEKIRSFRTAPLPGSSVHFAIMGDVGQFPHSEEAFSRLLDDRESIDLMILAGDIAYTNVDQRRWDTFFDFLDDYPMAERVPLQICPGNHDIDKEPDGSAIFQAYETRFRMPRARKAELYDYDGPLGELNMDTPPYPLPYNWGNAFHSFSYGAAKVVMISSYSSMEPRSAQYKWIVQELENVDRSKTPWLLAVIHTPIYNTFGLHLHDLQIIAAREHLEPLFVKYKVNLVFSGHIHAYLRTTNVAFGKVDAAGPIHVTVGSGGRKCEAPFLNAQPEPWVEVRDATMYGYGMLHIHNASTAEWDWIHTGITDGGRTYNEIYHSNATLPPGPATDRVFIENQYFL